MVSDKPVQEIAVFVGLATLPYALARCKVVKGSVEDVMSLFAKLLAAMMGQYSVTAHLIRCGSEPLSGMTQNFLHFLAVNLLTNAVPDGFEMDVPKILRFLDANGDGTLEAAEIEGFVYEITSRVFSAAAVTHLLQYVAKVKRPPAGWSLRKSRLRSFADKATSPLEAYWRKTAVKAGWWMLLDRIITGVLALATMYTWLVALGVSPQTVVATGGAGGLALGLAAQQVVGNGVAALIILATAPCSVGDLVEVGDPDLRYRGHVREIGWNATKLDLGNGEFVFVPNRVMLESSMIIIKAKGVAQVFKDVFDSCDTDGNGRLSLEELVRTLQQNITAAKAIGISSDLPTEEREVVVSKLFKELDVNGDGRVTRSEFDDWIQKTDMFGNEEG